MQRPAPARSYTRSDIVDALRAVGLKTGDTVYVISGFWLMGGYDGGTDSMAEGYYLALREVLGEDGTIVVPTATLNLCNTDEPFDPDRTPTHNRGVFPEYVRRLPGSRRSFHPFGSYAAVGRHAALITENVSRHVYGPESPEARIIELDGRVLNIGRPPNICSTVHHVEQLMAVPYRYTKEFIHPVVRAGTIVREPFYMYVQYLNIGVARSYNQKLFERLRGRLEIAEAPLGRGKLYSYNMAGFVREATKLFAEDMYIWCREPPAIRPYQS